MTTTVDLVFFDAGGGHRASAEALRAVLQQRRPDWKVRLVQLFGILDPQGHFRRVTGFAPEALYNQRLRRGWTLGLAQELKVLQGMIRLGHTTLVKTLQQHWLATEPDLVVSLIPNFNRALHDSLASTLPGVPFVTLLTDLADHPPAFWIETGQVQDFICGTPRAVAQALAAGHAPQRVHASSGMILRPDFYDLPPLHRDAARRARGLDADRPTGIVMFGGHGSQAMLHIARELADVQLILVCGHNRALERQLRALPAEAPRQIIGFERDIAGLMRLADFFIGKPGPGSLSEAVHLGLPVVVARNAWTMPQERYNTDWVRENGLGAVVPSFRRVRGAVDALIPRLPALRAHLGQRRNEAVFEVPAILQTVLERAAAPRGAPPEADSARGRRSAQGVPM